MMKKGNNKAALRLAGVFLIGIAVVGKLALLNLRGSSPLETLVVVGSSGSELRDTLRALEAVSPLPSRSMVCHPPFLSRGLAAACLDLVCCRNRAPSRASSRLSSSPGSARCRPPPPSSRAYFWIISRVPSNASFAFSPERDVIHRSCHLRTHPERASPLLLRARHRADSSPCYSSSPIRSGTARRRPQ